MTPLAAAAVVFSTLADAAKHHLFVGSHATTSIHAVTYDDKSATLLVQDFPTTRAANERLALSYSGRTLYSAGAAGWSSFDVVAPGQIAAANSSNAPAAPGCGAQAARGGGIVAAAKRPFGVYGALACANRVAVDGATGHVRAAAPVAYGGGQVEVAGVALDPAGRALYSTDWRAGRLWTHAVGAADGGLAPVGSVGAPSEVARPAAVAAHPSGCAVYVALASWNSLAHYTVDQATRVPAYSGSVRNLVPAGASRALHLKVEGC
jgi:carboxy-cis,cis-muconate cyclase